MSATDTHRAIDAVWRIESARLIAGLARLVRDVGRAEELAQDALVACASNCMRMVAFGDFAGVGSSGSTLGGGGGGVLP